MDKQTPVVFTNRKGLRLFGILQAPASQPAHELGIILLSPGVKMRVGPQRLYKRMTEHFVSLGIPVLRFDFYGLGDSEGALPEALLKDVYNHIEVGRFVDDTLDAMDWMAAQCGTRRFILSGLCGGAITGLLTGARDPRVAGLLGLGITPLLASRSADPSLYMTSGQLQQIGRSYIQKLLDPGSWLRLLSLKSDYRLIWRSVFRPLRPKPAQAGDAAAPPEHDNASPLFPPAFFRMLASERPMLLVFGGSDRLHWEFEEKFVARHQQRLAAMPKVWDVHVVGQANHVLSFDAWQREMLDVSTRWLQQRFGPAVAVRPEMAAAAN